MDTAKPTMQKLSGPILDVDLYSEREILDPYPTYDRLRELGPAVFIPTLNVWAITRYQEARDMLRDTDLFISSRGVTSNDVINPAFLAGTTLTTDGPAHDRQKKVMTTPLSPMGLADVREPIRLAANALVDRLPMNIRLNAVSEISRYLPLTIVSNLVGIPDEGREHMLEWAAAVFNVIGSGNERGMASLPVLSHAVAYAQQVATREMLSPGSWGARLCDALDRGEIEQHQTWQILLDYLLPSLDTTISATSTLVWKFGETPEQWQLLRDRPELIMGAINEAVRLESPIRGFTRYVTREHRLDEGVVLPKGARVLILYGAANRDPRKYEDPAAFRIERVQADHLGFGHGSHACAGMHLAKLEMSCLLKALATRVERFEIHSTKLSVINALRGLETLEVTLH